MYMLEVRVQFQEVLINSDLVGNATEIYSVDRSTPSLMSTSPLTPMPYEGAEFSFNPMTDANGYTYFKVLKITSSDVEIGEWFFNIGGQNTLVEFQNVPDPVSHPDVVVYDTTTGSGGSWTVDPGTTFTVTSPNTYVTNGTPPVPIVYSSAGRNTIFTFMGTDTSVSCQINYYGTLLSPFTINLESGIKTVVNVVRKQSVTVSGTILSYGLDPTGLITYTNSARLKTTNARVTLNVNNMIIENDLPNGNPKERSTIYIKTSTGVLIYEIYTYPIPYQQNENVLVELYDNDPSIVPAINYSFPNATNLSSTSPLPAITILSGNPITQTGTTQITYSYFDYVPVPAVGSTPAFIPTFNVILRVVHVPSNVSDDRIIAVSKSYKFNVISEYFGGTSAQLILDSVSVTPSVSNLVWQPSGEITFEVTDTGGVTYNMLFICNSSSSRIPTIEAVTGVTAKNIKVSDFIVNGNIDFISYNPLTTPHYVLSNYVSAPARTFTGIFASIVDPGNTETITSVNYNGTLLSGTSNLGFSWLDPANLTLAWNTNSVNDYFFYSNKEVIRITTIVLFYRTYSNNHDSPIDTYSFTFNLYS